MEKEDLQEIIDSYKWIKVKKLDLPEDPYDFDSHEELILGYEELTKHHTKETEFLINKCRELAKELIAYKELEERA